MGRFVAKMAQQSLNQVEPSQRDAEADRDKPTEMQMAPRLDEPGVSHGSKRKRPSSVKESCPNECCNCQEQIKDLKSQIELLNTQMEARLHAYVQTHVQGMLSKMEASALPPAKKAKRSVRSQERHCFVCGGHEGTVLNRQLGVVLDDRCRKQMDVIKHGGKLTERKPMWERAIVHLSTPAAQMLAGKLGLALVPSSAQQNVTSCPADIAGMNCAVCMEKMGLSCRIQTLECGSKHTFHHECIEPWLKESTTCPLCREDLSGTVQCRMVRAQPPTHQPVQNSCADSLSLDDAFDTDLLSMIQASEGHDMLQNWNLEMEPERSRPACSVAFDTQIPTAPNL